MAIYSSLSGWRPAIATLGILIVAMGTTQNAQATTYTFVTQTSATYVDWHTDSLWSPTGIPNSADDAVIFNRPLLAGATGSTFTVNVDQNTTVGSITVDNTNNTNNNNLVLDNFFGTLTFQTTSGSATWTQTGGMNGGRFDMKPDITLLSDLVITQENRPDINSASFLRGLITGATDRTITKEGAANLQLESHNGSGFQGQYIINNGALRFTGNSNISQSTGVTINSGGQMQFNANDAALTYDWSLASGAVLNLNGTGKASGSASAGALRFQGQGSDSGTNHPYFHNPVVLQSDATIAMGPASVTAELDNVVSGDGGLTVAGPGTLILSNAGDSYIGDTTVGGAGILSITNPILADGSDVYLATGTFLNLDFSGTDVIDSLFIDDTSQETGTWGAMGSGADHESDLITGSGLLQVSTFVSPGVPGDYNGNGVVDAADYVLWRNGGPLQNEVDNPGVVDQQDYVEWRARFGNTSGSGSLAQPAAVPEPTTALLTILALFALLASSRNR